MRIWLDMDGTIADLYGVENWLQLLEAQDPRPYIEARPIVRMASLAKILKDEGFIEDYKVNDDNVQGTIDITLKYGKNKERVITGLKRISKPGLRVYAKSTEIPKVLNGLGIAVISTSHGVMTDKEARKQNLGGEVLCYIW